MKPYTITIDGLPDAAMEPFAITGLLDAARLMVASVLDASDGRLADADIAEEHSF